MLRLVGVLREHPSAAVYVRHDQRRTPLAREDVEAAGGRLLEDGLEVEWGNWAYLHALLHGLRVARGEADPDWTIVLSGQDYPVRPYAELESFLAGAGHHAHLEGLWRLGPPRLSGGPRDEFVLRYAYRHFALPAPRRLPRQLAYRRERPPPLRPLLGLRRLRGPELPLYVSADWPTLSRRAVGAVLRFVEERTGLMRRYRGSFVPAESLFATALMNEPGLSVGSGGHRYLAWAGGTPHPRVLTQADLPAIRRSAAHFARKFDPAADAAVLDALDRARVGVRGRASL